LAIADLETASALYPSNPNVYAEWAHALTYRGDAHRKTGDFVAALKDLNKAIKLDPELESAYVARALNNSALGRDNESTIDLEKAVALGFNRYLLIAMIEETKLNK
jgi:tetratricopeptide (TPR) repeat protein